MFSLSHDLVSSLPFTNPLEVHGTVKYHPVTSMSIVFEYYEFGRSLVYCFLFTIYRCI